MAVYSAWFSEVICISFLCKSRFLWAWILCCVLSSIWIEWNKPARRKKNLQAQDFNESYFWRKYLENDFLEFCCHFPTNLCNLYAVERKLWAFIWQQVVSAFLYLQHWKGWCWQCCLPLLLADTSQPWQWSSLSFFHTVFYLAKAHSSAVKVQWVYLCTIRHSRHQDLCHCNESAPAAWEISVLL